VTDSPTTTDAAGSQPTLLRTYCSLLAAILAAFTIEGIAEPGRWELPLLTLLLGSTLILAFRVGRVRPVVMRVAVTVVVLIVAFSVVQALAGTAAERWAQLAGVLLVVFAPPAILVGVVRRMRETQSVTIEAVIGVLCIYILLGMFYAFLYTTIDHFGDGPFFEQEDVATIARCLYYSFTTLCTVGYGDFTARTNLGHTLSVSEALFGQVYLVTVVSLIVGNLGRRRQLQ
jgi:Ion channel